MKPFAELTHVPTYRLDLQYLGSGYFGWQSQPGGTGIQDEVEKALKTLLRHPLRVIGASRTDTGVHAEHQVAIFKTEVPYEPVRWLKALNGLLPDTIGVVAVAPSPPDFHPVYSAKAKAYRYRLWRGPTRSPQAAPYCWGLYVDLDVERLRQAALVFRGTHDFSAFCAADSSAKTRRRTIVEIEVYESGPLVEIWIVGEGFLKQMVRIMVGTLVDIGLGKRGMGSVAELLAGGDRTAASRTAPAQGLSLVEIFYGEIPTIAALRERLGTGFALRLP